MSTNITLDFETPATGSQQTVSNTFGTSPVFVIRSPGGGTTFNVEQTADLTANRNSGFNLIGFWENQVLDSDLAARGGGTVFASAPNSNFQGPTAHVQVIGALGTEAQFYYGTRNELSTQGFTAYAWDQAIRKVHIAGGDAQLYRATETAPDDVFYQFALGAGQPFGPAVVNGLGYDENGVLKSGPGYFNEFVFTSGTHVGSGEKTTDIYEVTRPGASQVDDLTMTVTPVADILRNSVTAVPDGATMRLYFQPKGPAGDVNLQDLAQALGVDHFNWRQTLVDWPETWEMFTVDLTAFTSEELTSVVNGASIVNVQPGFDGTPAVVLHADGTTSPLNAQVLPRPTFNIATQLFDPPVFDPYYGPAGSLNRILLARPPGDQYFPLLQSEPSSGNRTLSFPDYYQYLYDETNTSGHWSAQNPRFYQRPNGTASVFSFDLADRPFVPAGAFDGAETPYLQYMTELVGVTSDKSGVSWRGLGTNFTWKTNAVTSFDQMSLIVDPEAAPPIASGGVFDVFADDPTLPNSAPVATDDAGVRTGVGAPVVIPVVRNDRDTDFGFVDPTSVAIVTAPANGTAVIDPATGSVTYTPNAGFLGTDTFQYTVADNRGALSNVATVTIQIAQAPIAVDDSVSSQGHAPVTIAILANDYDPDGSLDATSVSIVTPPANGSIAVNATTGDVTYTPNPGSSGTDTFTYTVRDNDGIVSNEATVTVTVPPDQPPVANADAATVRVDRSVIVDVLANDADPDGSLDLASVTVVSPPSHGTATIAVQPGALLAVDDDGSPIGNGVASALSGTVTSSGRIFLGVSGYADFGFTGAHGQSGAYALYVRLGVSDFSNFDPGIFDFQYTGSLTPGLADFYTLTGLAAGTPFTAWLDNTVGSGSPDTVLGTFGDGGPGGGITYTPDPGFIGTDTFTYTVRDDGGSVSNVATVTVTVLPNQPPTAVDDQFVVETGTTNVVDVLANDSDPDGSLDPGSVGLVAAPVHGSIAIDPTTGRISYTPAAGYLGSDGFTYTVRDNDGAISNTAAVALNVATKFTLTSPTTAGLLPEGVTPVGGIVLDLIGINGVRVVSQLPASSLYVGYYDSGTPTSFQGNPGTIGIQTGFTQAILDALGGGLSQVAVRISLFDGDTGPGDFDDGGQNFLLLNGVQMEDFSDVPTQETTGDGQTVLSNNPGGGFRNQILDTGFFYSNNPTFLSSFFASLASGQVVYQLRDTDPYDNFFDFTQGVDGGLINVGQPPNVSPIARNDAATTPPGTAISVDVLANDSDPDGTLDRTTVAVVAQPANGVVVVDPATGRITYTPAAGFAGSDTFTYTVKDDDGATSSPATVTITVLSPPSILDVRVRFGSQVYSLVGNSRVLPWTNISAIEVVFDQNVAVDLADLRLGGVRVSNYALSFRYDASTFTAVWILGASTPLTADRLILTLDGDDATSDGNDGVSAINGGARLAGGDYSLTFQVLAGDYNGDGVVTILDSVLVRNHTPGFGVYDIWADLDGDGDVDLDDINAPRRLLGRRLP